MLGNGGKLHGKREGGMVFTESMRMRKVLKKSMLRKEEEEEEKLCAFLTHSEKRADLGS